MKCCGTIGAGIAGFLQVFSLSSAITFVVIIPYNYFYDHCHSGFRAVTFIIGVVALIISLIATILYCALRAVVSNLNKKSLAGLTPSSLATMSRLVPKVNHE